MTANTNVIEAINNVIRKRTSNRKIFPNETSAFQHRHLAIMEESKKWTMPIWLGVRNHLGILFKEDVKAMSQYG